MNVQTSSFMNSNFHLYLHFEQSLTLVSQFFFQIYQNKNDILGRHFEIRLTLLKISVRVKWVWRAYFLSYTLQILKISITFEDVQMVLL